MALTDHDQRTIRCRRLGHQVAFHYCRTQEGASICARIVDCWWEVFDVHAFLKEHLAPEELEGLASQEAPPKMLTLVQLIEQARKDAAQKRPDDT